MSRQEPTYEECYALILLQECLGMSDLKLSDRPDIRCNNQVGIEVVSALFEAEKRIETILQRRREGKKADPIPAGYTETCFLMGPTMVEHNWMKIDKYDRSTSDAIELIKSAIDDKKAKVNSYNEANNFNTDRLFVFADLGVDDEIDLNTIGKDIYQYAQGDFHTLYISVRDASCLMVCDANGVYLYYHQEKQYEYSLLAYDMYKKECGHE